MTGLQILQALETPAQNYLENCERSARPAYIRWIAAAACLCLLLAVGVPLYRQYGKDRVPDSGPLQTSAAAGGYDMPEKVLAQAPTVVGTGFTQEEIDYGLGMWTQFSVLSAGEIPDDAVYAKTGFCHVSLTDDGNEVRRDFYDIPLLADGRIVGMVTLFRVDGEVHSQFAYGGVGWDGLNRLLDAHPGEDLLMVYLGFYEAILAPDGEILSIRDDPEGVPENPWREKFSADVNWYELLYAPDCILNSAIRGE